MTRKVYGKLVKMGTPLLRNENIKIKKWGKYHIPTKNVLTALSPSP